MTNGSLTSHKGHTNAQLIAAGHSAMTRREWEALRDEGEPWLRAHTPAQLAEVIIRGRLKRQRIPASASAEPTDTRLRQWIWARSLLDVDLASEHDGLAEFRRQFLPDGLIALGSVADWIAARAPSTPTRYATVTVPVPVPDTWQPGDPVIVEWRRAAPLFLESSSRDFSATARTPTRVGEVLDRLRILSEQLASVVQWQPAQATDFILTGATPLTQLLTVTERHSSTGSRVRIDADPDVPAEWVELEYRHARLALLGSKRARLPLGKAINLVIMAAENPGATDPALWRRWNESHPDETFRDVRAFRQALRDARRRLTGTPRHPR